MKNCVNKLVEKLRAYRETLKPSLACFPMGWHGGPYCLLVKFKHQTWWVKILSFDSSIVGDKKRLVGNKLKWIRIKTYYNTWLSKEKAKAFHDRRINRKGFSSGEKIVLYYFILLLLLEKLGLCG